MSFLNIENINCLLTIGIVVFAFLQWQCTDIQRKTELFKYRVQHLQELKKIWNELMQNINYIPRYKAVYNIHEDAKLQYEEIFNTLSEHLAYTKCYYTRSIYEQEKEFIELLLKIIPNPAIEASIFSLDIEKFDIISQKYKDLCNSCFDAIAYINDM